jgi:dephospho-CoA kinase
LTIGLTGDVGSGKSSVRRWLEACGAAGLDADGVVHTLLASDPVIIEAVMRRFGRAVVLDGAVNRAALAAQVFGQPVALADLEAILHPAVIAHTRQWLAQVDGAVAVVEAVKLVEAGMDRMVGQVWLVLCDRDLRRARLAERGWPSAVIDGRMAAGTPLAPRLARADVVIDNSGSWSVTERQLAVAWATPVTQTRYGGAHA